MPPKDSSSAARFTLAVDDSGVAVETSRKFEPSVVESKITVAVVVVVVEERFTDSWKYCFVSKTAAKLA